MKINQIEVTLEELTAGFDKSTYSGTDEDVYCYGGKLNCRPSYQRNYVYDNEKRDAVIETIMKGYDSGTQFPLNSMYWAKKEDGTYELLDGQQRTLSICLFRQNESCKINGTSTTYGGLSQAHKDWFNNYTLTIYVCEKDNDESTAKFDQNLQDWFQIINTAGEPLEKQEQRNAVYYGSWLSAAKKIFSNKDSVIFKSIYSTTKYMDIKTKKMNRQYFLEKVLKWKYQYDNLSDIEEYMSLHRNDADASDLFNYFKNILEWAKTMFPVNNPNDYKSIFHAQDWGYLYNTYKGKVGVPKSEERLSLLNTLIADSEIEKKEGIIEYILSGKDKRYLSFRTFDRSQKEKAFYLQNGVCPLCEYEAKADPNKQTKWSIDEMEGDHIIPWSRGGKTTDENCCMLCKHHNNHKSDTQNPYLEAYMKNLRDNTK